MTSSVGNTEFWSVDGVSLAEYGWNVATLGGRFNVPPLRGNNMTFSYVEGSEFRAKTPDSRKLTLSMWVTGVDPATGESTDRLLQWNDNWHFLTQLFWTPKRELTLTRRWLRTDPATGTSAIQVTTAKAQYSGGLEPSMTGRHRATFEVELQLADPFFYGTERVITLPLDDEVTVTNPGDYSAAGRHMFVDLVGPLHNPVLTNITPVPDVVLGYEGHIYDGQTLTMDIRNFTAVVDELEPSSPYTTNRVGFVRHSGTRYWFGVERGDNLVTLTADPDSGAGHAVLRYRPPYL